jgi:hypothetical protein
MQNNFDLDKIAQLARDNEYSGIPADADLYTTANAVTNLILEPLDVKIQSPMALEGLLD